MNESATVSPPNKKATGWPLAIIVTLVFVGLIIAWYFLIRTALENKPEVIEVKPTLSTASLYPNHIQSRKAIA